MAFLTTKRRSKRKLPNWKLLFFGFVGLACLFHYWLTNHIVQDQLDPIPITTTNNAQAKLRTRTHKGKSKISMNQTLVSKSGHLELGKKKYPIVSSYENGISACLLVMDDNHFLIEWIAFHYHTLPLRYLVIAVDPRSKTLPTFILDRWKYMNITIRQWDDAHFMSPVERREAEKYVRDYFGRKIGDNLIRHRARQRLFYYKCMVHLKEINKDWTVLIDSDEFLYVNYKTVARTAGHCSQSVPPITQEGSVLSFLKSELQRPGHNLTSPCIQIPRIRFGAVMEESPTSDMAGGLDSKLDANRFQTLRWRKHAHPNDYGNNRISKVLIDLSRVPWPELKPVDSIHRPVRSLCGQRRLHIRQSQQVLIINHYLGTWEQYKFRNDSRMGNERSWEQYNKVSQIQSQTDDEIRPWIKGFIDIHGLDVTKKLLKNVGEVGEISSLNSVV